jgi:hypothetical protein
VSRPLALDFFCCAGGIAVGLERAGFDVIGFDWKPNPHWCGQGPVHQVDLSTPDAIEGIIRAFAPDFVTASPPCQGNSAATPTRSRAKHAQLIGSTREAFLRCGVPGMIENVPPIPSARWPNIVRPDVILCGAMFPETQRLRRHRHFELLGWYTFSPAHVNCTFQPVQLTGHGAPGRIYAAERERREVESLHDGSTGSNTRAARERRDTITVCANANSVRGANRGSGWRKEKARRQSVTMSGNAGHGPGQTPGQNNTGPECIRWREAMGWIDGPRDRYSLAQAIPPAYGEWLGREFLRTRGKTSEASAEVNG